MSWRPTDRTEKYPGVRGLSWGLPGPRADRFAQMQIWLAELSAIGIPMATPHLEKDPTPFGRFISAGAA